MIQGLKYFKGVNFPWYLIIVKPPLNIHVHRASFLWKDNSEKVDLETTIPSLVAAKESPHVNTSATNQLVVFLILIQLYKRWIKIKYLLTKHTALVLASFPSSNMTGYDSLELI